MRDVLDLCYEYQKEILESDKKYVIGNFSRATGKTFTLIGALFIYKPKVCYFCTSLLKKGFINFKYVLEESVKEFGVLKNEIERIDVDIEYNNIIKIHWKDGELTKIYYYGFNGVDTRQNVDLVLYDECLPTCYDIVADKYISMVTINGFLDRALPNKIIDNSHIVCVGIKRALENNVYTMKKIKRIRKVCSDFNFFRKYDLFGEYQNIVRDCEIKKKDNIQLLDEQINKMLNELNDVSLDKTMTIKDITQTVETLVKIKKGLLGQ